MIDGVGFNGLGHVAAARARSAGGTGGRFAVAGDAGAPVRTQVAGGIAGLSLEGLLTLQGDPDPREQDRRAHGHADAMLRELGALQRAILRGEVTEETVRQLAILADSVPAAADPQLAALIRTVVVRGRVELARRAL
ncbi:MAG: flagellar assembly protein FliX [Acetobacteraceae bacterium]